MLKVMYQDTQCPVRILHLENRMYGERQDRIPLTVQVLYTWHIRHVVFQLHVTHTVREVADRQCQTHSRVMLYVTEDMWESTQVADR